MVMKRTCDLRRYRLLQLFLIFYTVLFVYIMKQMHDLKSNQEFQDEILESVTLKDENEEEQTTRLVNVKQERLADAEEKYKVLRPVYPQSPGPGENSTAVRISKDGLTSEEKKVVAAGWKKHGFNAYVSDLVSMHRKVKDVRPPECRSMKYPVDLPPVSVIIPFKNELLSILMRTVYSILEITPPRLITEIILVDDGSTTDELKTKLDVHVQSLRKVDVIRLKETVGLMMARQTGINAAQAEIIVVLDSHMEFNPGWLEPLIHRLQENPKALLNSNMGSIDRETFAVNYGPFGQFVWLPFFAPNVEQCLTTFKKEYIASRNKTTDPLLYPSITGMMIAMRKDFFQQLGGFDPGMKVWGTEQMELSVKVWTCGGTIELIPCSFAAHMFRDVMWNPGEHGGRNKRRFMEVWMDEYKEVYYEYNGGLKSIEIGDLQDRRRIRQENKCKPFKTYMEKMLQIANVYFPVHRKTRGMMKSKSFGVCLDAGNPFAHKEIAAILYMCHGLGWSQCFELSEESDLRHMIFCLYPGDNERVLIKNCEDNVDRTNTKWDYFMINPGNLTDRRLIRERNKCKPFQYYVDEMSKLANIYIPINRITKGMIRSKSKKYNQRCLDSGSPLSSSKPLAMLYGCHGVGWSQAFELSSESDFRHMIFCLYPDEQGDVVIKNCEDLPDRTKTKWDYTEDDEIVHRATGQCLTAISPDSVRIKPCDIISEQTWEWTRVR